MELSLTRRFVLRWISVIFIAGLLLSSLAWLMPRASAQDGRDCDDNAVIHCGALTTEELKQKCQANEGSLQAILAEFGITNCTTALDGLVEGRVTGDNKVFVGDRQVATDAMTAGRHDMPGSTPIAGGAAFKRPPSTSFVNPGGSLRALVKMDGDTFKYAVITSCGNPVTAVSAPPQPQPSADCTGLDIVSRPTRNTVNFVARAAVADGATVQAYNFDFDSNGTVDRRVETTALEQTASHTYQRPGTYKATVTVDTSLGPKTGGQCEEVLAVEEEKVPNFEIIKDVRVKGQTDWRQDVSAKPDDHLEYRITVRNTGQTDFSRVVVRDVIPNGVAIVGGSLRVNGQPNSGTITGNGINIGHLKAGQSAEITFEVAIAASTEACGGARLNNVAFAKPEEQPEEQDNATAEVCKPQVQAVQILTVTGPGGVAGIFALTSVAGAAWHHFRTVRRLRA